MHAELPGAPPGAAVAGPRPWRRILGGVLALLFLNAALSFSTWWPTPGIVLDHRIAPEFVWLWLSLLGWVAWRGALGARALAVFTLGYLALVIGRYADVTVPALFGRSINLYWDGIQIPRFLWVSAQDLPWWLSAGAVLGVGLLLWLLFRALRLAMRVAAHEAVPYALGHRWVWALTAALVVLVLANYAGVRATWPVVSKPVIPVYWRQVQLLATAFSPQRQAALLPPAAAVDDARAAAPAGRRLATLAGRDVYLIMLESYGAVVHDHPRAAQALAAARARFAADIAAGGHHVVSAFMRSPTFAGASDLAHLSILTGIDLSDWMRHDVLLTTQRPSLISLFREEGYRTFGLYPALSWEWPERAFYGFDVFLEGRTLGYRGPALGYWQIPDQFSAARLEQLHPRDASAPPRFVFFPTITTHLPFSPVPPFQADWERLLGPQPFDAAEAGRALAEKPDWLDMFPDYLRMIDYAYRWVGDYLRRPAPRETVYVLAGDHQPAANVTGEGASWDVPVHVVARDPALLARFVAQGFHPGLDPPRASLGGLHDLTAVMLRAFGGGVLEARAANGAGAFSAADGPNDPNGAPGGHRLGGAAGAAAARAVAGGQR